MSTEGTPAGRPVRQLPRLLLGALTMLLRAAPGLVAAVLVLTLLNAAMQGAALLAIRDVIDTAIQASGGGLQLGLLLPRVGLFTAIIATAAITQLLMGVLQTLLVERVTYTAFERVLDVAGAVELEAFDTPEFHQRLARAQQAGGRPVVVTQALLGVARSASTIVSLLAVLFTLQPLLVPPLLVMVAPLVAANVGFSKRLYRFAVDTTERERRRHYLRTLLTARPHAAEIRAYGLVEHLRQHNSALFRERDRDLRQLTRRGLPRMIAGGVAASVAIAGSVGVLMGFVMTGRVPLASAAVGALTVVQLSGILTMTALNIGQLYESSLFLDDYRRFCDMLLETRQRTPGRPAPGDVEEIRVEDVSFRYPLVDTPALDTVSLHLRRGEIVALVGENGSGKTTLAKLLCRLYLPTSGQIRWDGVDTREIDPASLRDQVAVVFQDFGRYLFPVAENIGLGRLARRDDRPGIERAAMAADADGFIQKLANGYDTMLGKAYRAGVDLSVGQWQRLALSRAFFRDARLVILDEPTAALDPRAEHALFESMRRLFAGRTVLLISHRFSTVRSADRIYVLDRGRIAESGSHEQLLAAEGRYAEMYELHAQARGADLRTPR